MNIEEHVKTFIAIGARPTWSEWIQWTPSMQQAAMDAIHAMSEFSRMAGLLQAAPTKKDKLRIAEEMAHIDNGEMAKELRKEINRETLMGAPQGEHSSNPQAVGKPGG